jgi:hypothetical protein
MKKIATLKSQNKSIEEIYKYTNEIIFEEDEEDDISENFSQSPSFISRKQDSIMGDRRMSPI